MKKRGKFEKVPEPVPVKQKQEKTVKDALLQTYFVSLLSLVLCVTMFLGTSYAWFTSEVKNADNELYIGVLDVEMEKKVGDDWKSLSETGANGANVTKLFDKEIRWEPGYTMLETVKVTNKGDLAFHYVLSLTDGTITAAEGKDTTLDTAAGAFDVWVYTKGSYTKDPADTFAAMIAKEGWKRVGTLAEVLNGTAVVTNEMNKDAVKDTAATEHTYTIAVHMNEAASAQDIMGSKIKLNVKLIAYQMSEEVDAFGNDNYDNAVVMTVNKAELKQALSEAGTTGTVSIATDMNLTEKEDLLDMAGGTLDGNGNTLTYSGGYLNPGTTSERSPGVLTTSGGTIRNLTIEGSDQGRALYAEKLTSDLTVSDCVFSGAYSFNLNSAVKTTYNVTFINTVFENWTSYDNVAKKVVFERCTFQDVLRPYGDTELKNSTISHATAGKAYLDVSKLVDGETVTLENCTYNGVTITRAVIRNSGVNIVVDTGYEVTGNHSLAVEGGKLVVE